MLQGIRSKQRKRPIQMALDLPQELTGIIKITIPNQRCQTKTNLRSKSSPDPGGPETSASPHLWEGRFLGIIGPMGFWCFFLTKVYSSSTWTWETLRSRRSVSLTCSQCNAAVESHPRMVSSLISRTREVPRSPRPSANSLRPISTFLLGLRRPKNAVPVRLEKALPQVRHRKSCALPVLRVR